MSEVQNQNVDDPIADEAELHLTEIEERIDEFERLEPITPAHAEQAGALAKRLSQLGARKVLQWQGDPVRLKLGRFPAGSYWLPVARTNAGLGWLFPNSVDFPAPF